jgi:hypothetical protein
MLILDVFKNNIIFDELAHLVIALGIGLFFFWRYRRWELILAALGVGFLIDIDHFFDYWTHFGLTFNPRDFFNVHSYMDASGRVFVLFHGWEWVFIWFGLGWLLEKRFKIPGLKWALTLAYLGHLIWDYLPFWQYPLNYSLIYRGLRGFELAKMLFY